MTLILTFNHQWRGGATFDIPADKIYWKFVGEGMAQHNNNIIIIILKSVLITNYRRKELGIRFCSVPQV